MKFYISAAANDYITQKGGEIIIFKGNLTGCCGGTMPSPMLEIGHQTVTPGTATPGNSSGPGYWCRPI